MPDLPSDVLKQRKLRPLARRILRKPTYNHDSLAVWNKHVSFITEPRFVHAYETGMDSGHKIAREAGSKEDIGLHWRVHIALWAAQNALLREGDFVECGVNTGILSLAICDYLDFSSTGRRFFLFDTYEGIPEDQVSARERELGRLGENAATYEDCFDQATRNFAPWPNAILVRGRVPDTLSSVDIETVAYLSLDMNIAEPEIAAIEYFWDRMSPGAIVLLDDYGWTALMPQKEAMDEFAASKGVAIMNSPTGQGILLKP